MVDSTAMLTRTPQNCSIDLEAEADLKRCGALKDFWYVACLSKELLASRPLRRILFGTHLVLFRNEQKKAIALRDRCLHRNACLSEGEVHEGKICCPYHGWVYNEEGACVRIPSLGPAQEGQVLNADRHFQAGLKLCPAEVGKLQKFETIEQDGLIYVFMGENVEEARRPPFRVPYYHDSDWCTYFMITRFPNGVTNLVENFMDVPHTVFVHKGWFRRAAQKCVPATVERKEGSVLVTYEQEKDKITGLGRLLNPMGEAMLHTDHFFIPNITRVDYTFGKRSGFMINSQVTPVGPLDSMVYTAISYRLPFDLPKNLIARFLQPLMHWYTRQVIEQDVQIMRKQKQGLLNGPGAGQFVSTEADLLHADIEAYREWLRRGGQGEGPSDECRKIAFWI